MDEHKLREIERDWQHHPDITDVSDLISEVRRLHLEATALQAECDMWKAQVTDLAQVHKAVDMLTDQRNSARAELNTAMHDIEAYRGALGYDVAGCHDGRLSNGTTPRCGLCDAARLEALKCKDVGVSTSGQSGHGACLQNTTDVLATSGCAEGVDQSKREADALVGNQPAPLDSPDAPVFVVTPVWPLNSISDEPNPDGVYIVDTGASWVEPLEVPYKEVELLIRELQRVLDSPEMLAWARREMRARVNPASTIRGTA